MLKLPDPQRDTACWSARQWHVGGYAFTTKEDAEAAIMLAHKHGRAVREEWAREMSALLDKAEYGV